MITARLVRERFNNRALSGHHSCPNKTDIMIMILKADIFYCLLGAKVIVFVMLLFGCSWCRPVPKALVWGFAICHTHVNDGEFSELFRQQVLVYISLGEALLHLTAHLSELTSPVPENVACVCSSVI